MTILKSMTFLRLLKLRIYQLDNNHILSKPFCPFVNSTGAKLLPIIYVLRRYEICLKKSRGIIFQTSQATNKSILKYTIEMLFLLYHSI